MVPYRKTFVPSEWRGQEEGTGLLQVSASLCSPSLGDRWMQLSWRIIHTAKWWSSKPNSPSHYPGDRMPSMTAGGLMVHGCWDVGLLGCCLWGHLGVVTTLLGLLLWLWVMEVSVEEGLSFVRNSQSDVIVMLLPFEKSSGSEILLAPFSTPVPWNTFRITFLYHPL